MAKERAHIVAYQNGVPRGYIRSVSETKGTFTLTHDKSKAKGYATQATVQREIDALTRIGYAQGYIFGYD